MTTLCTLFTSTKPFTGHDATTQRNALANWRVLGLRCMIMGDDAGAAEAAREFGFQHFPGIAKTRFGTPLLSDMFEKAQANATTRLVCYINADILLPPSFLTALNLAAKRWEAFLMIGQRWNIDLAEKLDFTGGWPERLEAVRRDRGKLFSPWGMDYFAFPRGMVRHMPPFAVGRPVWDNWLVWTLAESGIPLLNATQGVPALHQNHAYKHVPEGDGATYAGPESYENLRLCKEDAPDLDTLRASTYRAAWRFDGNGVKPDASWGRWWWHNKHKFGAAFLPGRLRHYALTGLRALLGPEKYAALRDKYRASRGIDSPPEALMPPASAPASSNRAQLTGESYGKHGE